MKHIIFRFTKILSYIFIINIFQVHKVVAISSADKPDLSNSYSRFNISSPDSNLGSINSIQENMNKLMKGFSFSPILNVNPNQGVFSTAVSINLPPHLVILKSLTMNYRSDNFQNVGLGLGWAWNLPMIKSKNIITIKSQYYYSGPWGVMELVETQESLNSLTPVLSQILGQSVKSKKILRPILDEHGIVFIKTTTVLDEVYWVAMNPIGERWLFTESGMPIRQYDIQNHFLEFYWRNGVLISINDDLKKWNLSFEYTQDKQEFPKYLDSNWFQLPKGLKSLTQYSTLNEQNIVYDFTMSDEYLTQVMIRGGVMPIFIGSYSNIKAQEISRSSNGLNANDKNIFINKNNKSEELIAGNDNSFFVDINGDHRTDQVIIKIDEYNNRLKVIADEEFRKVNVSKDEGLDGLHNEMDKAAQRTIIRRRQEGNPNISVNFAYSDNPQAEAKMSEDLNVNINKILNDNNLQLLHLTGNHDGFSSYQENHLQFIDINGDNLKDLIIIPNQKEWNGLKNQFQKWLSKTFGLAVQPETDWLQFVGATPIIYVQYKDEAKIQQMWVQYKGSSAPIPESNFIKGVTLFQKLNDVGSLKMNQESQIVDLGNGEEGILTGKTFYLIHGFNPQTLSLNVKAVPFNFESIIQKGSNAWFDENNVENITLMRIESGQKVAPVTARQVLSLLNTQTIKLIKNGETIEILPAPPMQLLTHIYSPFGGHTQIIYRNEQSRWVVKQVIKNPLDEQPIERINYYYNSPLYDIFHGVFVGFSTTSEIQDSTAPQIKPITYQKQFLKDLDPSVILFQSRGRINGRPTVERMLDKNNIARVIKVYSVPKGFETSDQRMMLLPQNSIESHYEEDGKTIYRQHEHFYNLYNWTKNELGDSLIPLGVDEVHSGIGLKSIVSDAMLDAKFTIFNQYQWDEKAYLMLPLRQDFIDKNNVPYAPSKNFTYNESLQLTKLCEVNRCSEYQYDMLGRLTQVQKTNGESKTFSYLDKTPLLTSVQTLDGLLQLNYNPLNHQLLSSTNLTGSIENYFYTPDGITKSIHHNGNLVFNIQDLSRESIQNKKLSVQNGSQSEVWIFDGLGRIAETLKWQSSQWISSGKKVNFGNDVLMQYGIGINVSSSNVVMEKNYDELGRLASVYEESVGLLNYNYNDNCVQNILNNFKETEICRTSLGNLSSQRIGAENISITTMNNNKVMSVYPYNIDYSFNKYVETKSSRSINSNNGVPSWTDEGVVYSEQKLTAQTKDNRKIEFDSQGRMIKTTVTSSLDPMPWLVSQYNQYSNGLLAATKWTNIKNETLVNLNFNYTKDGQISRADIQVGNLAPIIKTMNYDMFGRVTKERILNVQPSDPNDPSYSPSTEFNYNYEQNRLISILPYITNIQYDIYDRLTQINYQSGQTLIREYDGLSSRVSKIEMRSSSNKVLFREIYTYNSIHQLIKKSLTSTLKSEDENYNYDPKYYFLSNTTTSPIIAKRDINARASSLNKKDFVYVDDDLSSTGISYHSYGINHEKLISCAFKNFIPSKMNSCFIRLNSEEYMNGSYLVKSVVVGGVKVGVLIGQTFFPVVEDWRHSLRAVIAEELDDLIFLREFAPWGEKTLIKNTTSTEIAAAAKNYDFYIPWSFAGLTQDSIYNTMKQGEEQNLYWSESRVYSPEIREWLTKDPLVAFAPESLLDKPGNWHPTRYAGNDPVNFVDPSGTFAIAGAVIGGGIDLGVRLYVSNDRMATVQDWKTWASVGVSADLGATGAGLGEVSGNAAATFTASSLGQFATRTILNAAGSAALGAAGTAMNNAISRENASLKNSIMLNGILGGAGSILADGIRASVNSVAIKSWNNASLTDKLMMTILEPVKIGYSIESVTIGLGNIAGETVGNSAPIFENK